MAPDPVSFREVLEGRLTDERKARGKRHLLPSLVSVLVAGLAAACTGPLAVAQAAAGWDQEVLAAHGCWVSPRTGKRAAPSASMLDRLPGRWTPTSSAKGRPDGGRGRYRAGSRGPGRVCRAPRGTAA